MGEPSPKSEAELTVETKNFNRQDEKSATDHCEEIDINSSEISSLDDKDEAFLFLKKTPRAAELRAEGQAILDDPIRYKKLMRKVDMMIVPLLAAMSFIEVLDTITLEASTGSIPC
ncbi:hypothetical protein N0V82_004371 [Gnomoniopsis sp. IMI 355080]|nr:hypothetical protein N0V82_004371 [Gnomoniopsis sp. IMI 355080]